MTSIKFYLILIFTLICSIAATSAYSLDYYVVANPDGSLQQIYSPPDLTFPKPGQQVEYTNEGEYHAVKVMSREEVLELEKKPLLIIQYGPPVLYPEKPINQDIQPNNTDEVAADASSATVSGDKMKTPASPGARKASHKKAQKDEMKMDAPAAK